MRRELTEEHLNPIYLESAKRVRETVPKLGAPSYLELYRRFGFRLNELAEQCRAVLDATEHLWEEAGDRLFRARLGIGLDEAKRWDVARLARAPHWDAAFPGEAMLPALEATLADLGIDLRGQANVELDLERAAAEGAPRVLLHDRDPGPRRADDPADGRAVRLARPVPRGRPRRALRTHVGVSALRAEVVG